MLLWLWCRPGAAALIQPLAWELPYALGGALKRQKKKKKKKSNIWLLHTCNSFAFLLSGIWVILCFFVCPVYFLILSIVSTIATLGTGAHLPLGLVIYLLSDWLNNLVKFTFSL